MGISRQQCILVMKLDGEMSSAWRVASRTARRRFARFPTAKRFRSVRKSQRFYLQRCRRSRASFPLAWPGSNDVRSRWGLACAQLQWPSTIHPRAEVHVSRESNLVKTSTQATRKSKGGT